MSTVRTLVVLLILALSVAPLPTATAAEPLLTDPQGDTYFEGGAAGSNAPATALTGNDQTRSTDLLALEIIESEDLLTFAITVESLEGGFTGSEYFVELTWNSKAFVVDIAYFTSEAIGGGIFSNAMLFQLSSTGDLEPVAPLETPRVDLSGGRLEVDVSKVYLLDAAKRAPGKGDTLTGIRVYAEREASIGLQGGPEVRIIDSMPDTGAGEFTLELGDFSTGNLILTSPQRIRVSNGGSTTFVYQATIRNLADTVDEVRLSVGNLPEGWTATVQSPVRVPANAQTTVAVLASVPFEHSHGGFDSFILTAQSVKDGASQGRIKFGVLHTPIPQPAGHHSDLFLHADDPREGPSTVFAIPFPYSTGWMNTNADHSGDDAPMTPNEFSEGYGWNIPLSPGLQMGLDFDITKTGTLVGSVLGREQGTGTVTAKLWLVKKGGETLLAESDAVAVTLDPQSTTPFALTMTPTEDADYIAYAGDMGLTLVVNYEPDVRLISFQTVLPALPVEDFKLSLPLLEYHDRLTGVSEAAVALDLVASGAVERIGRPGTVLTYGFTLVNSGATPEAVVISVAGNDAARATLVPSGKVNLAPGETRVLTLAVDIPAEANDGQLLEVLIFAHAESDPSKRAIARTQTTVARGADAAADERDILTAAQAAEKDTPGPVVWITLVAVGAAMVVQARRPRRS